MNIKSKNEIRDIIVKDVLDIYNRRVELSKRLEESLDSGLADFQELVRQLSERSSGPFIAKTPKMLRKKAVQRIETIPENEVFETTSQRSSSRSSFQSAVGEADDQSQVAGGRAKRHASKKAAENIYKLSLLHNTTLQHKQLDSESNTSVAKGKRETRVKRKKSLSSSDDDDDDNNRSIKYSKIENTAEKKGTRESTRRATKKKSEQISRLAEKTKNIENEEDTTGNKKSSFVLPKRILRHSKTSQNEEANKNNDEIVAPTSDTFDASVYEDAIGKPIPIMNSTLKYSLVKSDKVMNATVVLERISHEKERPLNLTVVLKKRTSERGSIKSRKSQEKKASAKYIDNCNGLITDDESSPETKKSKQAHTKEAKRAAITTSESEIPNAAAKTHQKAATSIVSAKEGRAGYKSNALFSPYAEESVRKRVKAFEEAVMSSPANSVDVDAPTRMTRTKTRAMTAAETEVKNTDKNVAQILARKSIAKAKRISLARQKKDNEESKENKEMPVRLNKLISNDKTGSKQMQQQQQQQKTPLFKMRSAIISSVNRVHTPLSNQNLLNYPKPLTASRANIVTNVESFIQPKSMTKTNSAEQLDEEKNKRSEEDARKKKGDALRLLTEERKRKREEKELKNRLAREAKERQELEKRQKAEKEREEKAKLALIMQEKQREEMEKKRLAQLQRAQEKEERRRIEEQQRLQRLQEQEETERLLAEQRRREQEAERRKEAELRAQQQAAAVEAQRQKNLMLAAQAAKQKQQAASKAEEGVKSYKLDSEPDEDESDDESKPKHEIPHWAQPHVRKKQLAMQQHIPQDLIFKFFDVRKCTPDLSEMFHGIDRSRLKRTSSAIWKTPPRISMMERLE